MGPAVQTDDSVETPSPPCLPPRRRTPTACGRERQTTLDWRRLNRTMPAGLDAASRRWVSSPRLGHPRRDQTVDGLHALLRRVAVFELSRRGHGLGLINAPNSTISRSRPPTTWLSTCWTASTGSAVAAASPLGRTSSSLRGLRQGRAARVAPTPARRRAHPRAQSPTRSHSAPRSRSSSRRNSTLCRRAFGELTARQREVFVSIALNEVPIDVVAVKLGTNRNAVYKPVRRQASAPAARMAAAGHPVGDSSRPETESRSR